MIADHQAAKTAKATDSFLSQHPSRSVQTYYTTFRDQLTNLCFTPPLFAQTKPTPPSGRNNTGKLISCCLKSVAVGKERGEGVHLRHVRWKQRTNVLDASSMWWLSSTKKDDGSGPSVSSFASTASTNDAKPDTHTARTRMYHRGFESKIYGVPLR